MWMEADHTYLFSEYEIQIQFYPFPPSPTPISQIFLCDPRRVFLIYTCATDTEVAKSLFSLDNNSIISVASLFFWHHCIFISGCWISWMCGWALKLKWRQKKDIKLSRAYNTAIIIIHVKDTSTGLSKRLKVLHALLPIIVLMML